MPVTAFAPVVTPENEILFRRRGKVLVPDARSDDLPSTRVLTVVASLHSVGYLATESLTRALAYMGDDELTAFHVETHAILLRARGGHKRHRPMYEGFPWEVIDADLEELYLNALLHYWTGGVWLPTSDDSVRPPLLDLVKAVPLDAGSSEDLDEIMAQISRSNNSLSETDVADLRALAVTRPLVFEDVPQRENRAIIAGLAYELELGHIGDLIKSPTDVLRLAAVFSGGDVSLAEPTRFSLTRPQRRLVLSLLERAAPIGEEVQRRAETWKRLAYEVHVGEHRRTYPKTYQAMTDLRLSDRLPTFGTKVELGMSTTFDRHTVQQMLSLLSLRPGYLARRLDHLLRSCQDVETMHAVADQFTLVSNKVATPLLLQVGAHFAGRSDQPGEDTRVFFPKGKTSRAHVEQDQRRPVPSSVSNMISQIADLALFERFSELPPMGRVYVDPALAGCPVPHAGRSSSPGSRQLARGTRMPLPEGDTVRMFIWWKNQDHHTVDLDLSAALLDHRFRLVEDVAYYNLRSGDGHHSGDIVSAPRGASEFIDYNMARASARGRYLAMTVNSYSGQKFSELDEVFAGWMVRQHPNSGEVYDPRTVLGRVDVTAASKMALPLVVDLLRREVVWCDMSMKARFGTTRGNDRGINVGGNNLRSNRATLSQVVEAVVTARRADLRHLMELHATVRGELVTDRDAADLAFTVDDLPFMGEMVAADYMA